MSSERYAGAVVRAGTMFDALEESEDPSGLVADFVRAGMFGEALPCDSGDVADSLIELLPRSARRTFVFSILRAASSAGGKAELPFALAAFGRTLGLPDESAVALFALGRTIGCVARAIEVYARHSE